MAVNQNEGESQEKIPPLDSNRVYYSKRYADDKYEYRHVILPKEFSKYIPRTHLLTETEWRNLGVQQSPGWEHFMIHAPEPHVLMYRRPLGLSQSSSEHEEARFSVDNDQAMESVDATHHDKKPRICDDDKDSDDIKAFSSEDDEPDYPIRASNKRGCQQLYE